MIGELRWFGHTLSPEFKSLEVIPFSDLHYGNPLCSMKHALRTIAYVADSPNRAVILNGDLIEAVTKTSKGDVFTQAISPQKQRDDVIGLLMPVKDKILGCTQGNHEHRIYEMTGIDISKDIAEALGVPYRAEGILLKISFGHGNKRVEAKPYVYWCYATHGYGGARTKAAKAVKVERVSTWIHADFYILSHDHVVNVAPDVYLLPDNRGYPDENGFTMGKITAKRKMLIKSGAFLKWGGYSEMGGFPPVDLSTVVITLSGEGKPIVGVRL